MPKSKVQKQQTLRDLSEKIDKAKSIIFAKFSNLEVKNNEDLRKRLKAENSEYLVAKKTLINIAFKDKKIEGFDAKNLEGQIGTVFGYGDEIAPAKIVAKFRKENEGKIDFAGGILENRFITADKVDALSKLPSREELYAKLVGSLSAPISGFVNVLAGNLRGLVTVLKAISEKKA